MPTPISWAHESFNFWMGCTRCAPECCHCYIPFGTGFGKRDPWADLYLTKTWHKAYTWQRQMLEAKGRQCKRVFTCSLSDFFHHEVDKRMIPEDGWHRNHVAWNMSKWPTWREAAWKVIRSTPNLIWLILTKRPELIADRLPDDWGKGFHNVWLGVSTGCKQTLHKVDILRSIPAAKRFVSCEPLLEDIADDLDLDGIDWVITGGESGHGREYVFVPDDWKRHLGGTGRRTMRLEWAENLLTLARYHEVPFWFKQLTAPDAGFKPDALGQYYHEVPDPPYGVWAEKEEK
jgi:protein gp37